MPEPGNGATRTGKGFEAEREGEGLGSGVCSVWEKGCDGTELGSHRGRVGLAGRDLSWPQDLRWDQT